MSLAFHSYLWYVGLYPINISITSISSKMLLLGVGTDKTTYHFKSAALLSVFLQSIHTPILTSSISLFLHLLMLFLNPEKVEIF